jgi:excisionase family DNA binding protein
MMSESHKQDENRSMDLLALGDLITLKQAAERSGFSMGYLRAIAQHGRLRAKKIGKTWLTTMAAVEEYKRTRTQIIRQV